MRLALVLALSALLALAGPAAAAPDLSEIIVDVREDKQPVRDVLRRLQSKHGLNYVVAEDVLAQAGTVTVQLSQVPLNDALSAICAACGLELSFRGPILVMLPLDGRARPRAHLPQVREGLLPEGASKTRPIQTPGPERFMAPRAKPVPPAPARPSAADESSSMMVGTVSELDMKNGRLQLSAEGVKRDFYLSNGAEGEHSMQFDKLRRAFAAMKPGHRVALLYARQGKRSVVTDLIGGDQVRAARIPTGEDRRRRRRGPPPLRAGTPPPSPKAKEPPAAPRRVLPSGVLAGRFVGFDNGVVKIKLADGKVVESYLPSDDDETRAKLEGVIAKLKPDAQVFMTYKEERGKLILRGGISETGK